MEKRWCEGVIIGSLLFLFCVGTLIVVIDPFFHYHKPLKSLAYRINYERYQNDGIVKQFDYDAMITGTSSSANFKTSEMDKLFGTHAIKVCYDGGGFKEIRENIERAIAANPDLRIIVWGLDYNVLFINPDYTGYKEYPTYLYDDSIINDVNYIFNSAVLRKSLSNLIYTIKGGHTTTFDEYSNWTKAYNGTFGKTNILKKYKRPEKREIQTYREPDTENVEKNILSLVKANPDKEFYFFLTPYSILVFDGYNRAGILRNYLLWEKEVIKMILPYENVHFFSFFDEFSMITNFDNYRDKGHYHERINSYLLECMATGKHRLTMENYEDYCQREWDFYTNYDYDAIYKK